MTQTIERSDRNVAPPPSEPVPRRPLLSRLSLGHLIMIIAGLIAFLLVLAVLRDRAQTTFIAVAATDIEAGTAVSATAFRLVEVSDSDGELTESFLDGDAVNRAVSEGWIATRSLPAGTPLASSDFRGEALDGDLRAMSIPINSGHAAAGALAVGDRVDVIVVRDAVASYVSTDVEVIAVNSSSSSLGSQASFTITVAVDADTSLRLASALNDGALELVRSTGAVPANPSQVYDPSASAVGEG